MMGENPTKVLVAAQALDPNRTSEGICSSKFLRAAASAGYDVACLTSDVGAWGGRDGEPVSSIGGVPLRWVRQVERSSLWTNVDRRIRSVESTGPLGRLAARKTRALVAFATGWPPDALAHVRNWDAALRQELQRSRPDVLFVRGAGGGLYPHAAVLRLRPEVPWVAHYHDPYPRSAYPEPYRKRVWVQSWHHERLHLRVLADADALTFPSRRLLEWVLRGQLACFREKAFVLPHIAGDLPGVERNVDSLHSAVQPGEAFAIVHTGTLLRPRTPKALLEAFACFLGANTERQQHARLVFVGRAHPLHTSSSLWRALSRSGNLVAMDCRISYHQALALARTAAAALLIEADALESPFFPAKLADYLWLRRPVLALSPPRSTAADLLGSSYRLLVGPGDVRGILGALELLWDAWKSGRLDELAPPADAARSVSQLAVRDELARVMDYVLGRQGRREMDRPSGPL